MLSSKQWGYLACYKALLRAGEYTLHIQTSHASLTSIENTGLAKATSSISDQILDQVQHPQETSISRKCIALICEQEVTSDIGDKRSQTSSGQSAAQCDPDKEEVTINLDTHTLTKPLALGIPTPAARWQTDTVTRQHLGQR